MIYFDTHAVVALYKDLDLLGEKARRLLRRQDDYAISPIVHLELQFLYEIQQIKHSPRQILRHLDNAIGLAVCTKPFAADMPGSAAAVESLVEMRIRAYPFLKGQSESPRHHQHKVDRKCGYCAH